MLLGPSWARPGGEFGEAGPVEHSQGPFRMGVPGRLGAFFERNWVAGPSLALPGPFWDSFGFIFVGVLGASLKVFGGVSGASSGVLEDGRILAKVQQLGRAHHVQTMSS